MIGSKFNRLTVVQKGKDTFTPKGARLPYYVCRCDCGEEVEVLKYNLTTNKVKSCGCLRSEVSSVNNSKHNLYGPGYCNLSSGETFLFDKEDFDKIKGIYWLQDKGTTIVRGLDSGKKYLLARVIANISEDSTKIVKLKVATALDYRKSNMVIISLQDTKTRYAYNYKTKKWELFTFVPKRDFEIQQREDTRLTNRYITLKTYIESKEGKLHETAYTNVTDKVHITCKNGHLFRGTYDSLVNSNHWCKNCCKFLSENKCRTIFENIFNKKFITTRLPILRPPRELGNRCLELDGYNKDLKLAFEHQGIQHYKYHPLFHRTTSLELIQQRDKFKYDKCLEHGIILIQIPTIGIMLNEEDLETFIVSELKRYNKFPEPPAVSWADIH